jgi:SAM-dependent methyltransferase
VHGSCDATHPGSGSVSAGGPRVDRAVRSMLAAALRSAGEEHGPGPSWRAWAFDRVLAHTPEVAAVLDVAAGTGMLWSCNYERLPMAWWVWLTDESPGAVAELRNALDGAPQVTVAHGRLGDLPLGDAAFDTVVANHILGELDDPDLALDEIVRVLRPGGTLIAGADGSRHLRELARLLGAGDAPAPVPGSPSLPCGFDLECGQAILAGRFSAVRSERFVRKMRLADVESVLALIAPVAPAPVDDRVGRIRSEIATVIERHGYFSLTIDTGILVATVA